MHNQQTRPTNQLVLIANDDQTTLTEQARACEAAGMQVAATGVDAAAFEVAASGAPSAIVIGLAANAGLVLLQRLARDPRTVHLPVIVSACSSEAIRLRAEQAGSVVIFLAEHSPETLVTVVRGVLGLGELAAAAHAEFPAQCPQCDTHAGMPRSVSTASVSGTYVGLECERCGQGWRILRPSPPLSV